MLEIMIRLTDHEEANLSRALGAVGRRFRGLNGTGDQRRAMLALINWVHSIPTTDLITTATEITGKTFDRDSDLIIPAIGYIESTPQRNLLGRLTAYRINQALEGVRLVGMTDVDLELSTVGRHPGTRFRKAGHYRVSVALLYGGRNIYSTPWELLNMSSDGAAITSFEALDAVLSASIEPEQFSQHWEELLLLTGIIVTHGSHDYVLGFQIAGKDLLIRLLPANQKTDFRYVIVPTLH